MLLLESLLAQEQQQVLFISVLKLVQHQVLTFWLEAQSTVELQLLVALLLSLVFVLLLDLLEVRFLALPQVDQFQVEL